ncbi:hypothetical protein D9619_009206 [Psilocybe cf. subviscida]|uniref:Uncharacterized protein n=1 Tax=Psilocybe cf. subviscida TaxID=2480587 RepID=A0A8H5BW83_9AGAR|nr:hypothetical protein D9619_009206 [Psilocybe cf. subviscida]
MRRLLTHLRILTATSLANHGNSVLPLQPLAFWHYEITIVLPHRLAFAAPSSTHIAHRSTFSFANFDDVRGPHSPGTLRFHVHVGYGCKC